MPQDLPRGGAFLDGGDHSPCPPAGAGEHLGQENAAKEVGPVQPPDVEHFAPMMEQVIENCGRVPGYVTADAGYFSERNLACASRLGIDAYIPMKREKHGPQSPEVRGCPPEAMTPKERMQRKLMTREGRERYARRKAVAEPPFGQIKQARGFRQFLLRGLEQVCGEWALICLTHNLLKLHRAAIA